ncbi:MAG: hypothetical protein PHI85_10290 [Victivallaceae bacterium]|nr:hypothetical protein [Victivallaceae bacterium]
MKILNIVLSILILLLAITSAVFSYFLFEKRTQMVDGYTTLSSGIKQASEAMDAGSGTAIAKSLGGDSLTYKSKDLSSAIGKLARQAKEVMKQRNELGDYLAQIDSDVIGENDAAVEASSLTSLQDYSEAAEKVVAQVGALKSNRDMLVNMLRAVGKDFDIALSDKKLKSSNRADYENELRAFVAELNNIKKYKSMQEAAMREIAAGLGVNGLTFSPVRYQDDLKKYTGAIDALKQTKASLDSANAKLNKELAAAKSDAAKLQGEIDALKAELASRAADYDRLQSAVEGKVYQYPVKLWQPGSAEARKAAEGKVIAVNAKFGYVVIDLGANSVVNQNIGDTLAPAPVNPELTADTTMVVSRDAKFIGRIKIFKVEDNCAFGSIADGDESQIKVGDTVIFGDETK